MLWGTGCRDLGEDREVVVDTAGRPLETVVAVPELDLSPHLADVRRVSCPAAPCPVCQEEADAMDHVQLRCLCLAEECLRLLGNINLDHTQLHEDSIIAALFHCVRLHLVRQENSLWLWHLADW